MGCLIMSEVYGTTSEVHPTFSNPCQYWHVGSVGGVGGSYTRVRACASASRAPTYLNFSRVRALKTPPTPPTSFEPQGFDGVGGTPDVRNQPPTSRLMDKIAPNSPAAWAAASPETMPETTRMVAEMRATFGADMVNAAIRAAKDGQPTFWASENGIELGVKAERGLTLDQMQKIEGRPLFEAWKPFKGARK